MLPQRCVPIQKKGFLSVNLQKHGHEGFGMNTAHSLHGENQQQFAGGDWLERKFRCKKTQLDVHQQSLRPNGASG